MRQRFKTSIRDGRWVMFCVVLVLAAAADFNVTQSKSALTMVQEKSVENSYKNIQVLKGLPESQLFSVMNYMRGSLGVSCAYCHVYSGEDKWSFASDEKQTKLTARRMIQMVFDLNKSNKDVFGSNSVSCFTCHRGSLRPVLLPTLPVPAPEGGAAGVSVQPNIVLPSPKEIMGKYVLAAGGPDRMAKLNSRVMTGAMISWDGTQTPLIIHLQRPDKILVIVNPGQAERTQGFNGATGWLKTPDQARELNRTEMDRLLTLKKSFDLLALTNASPEMKTISKEPVDNREAFVIERPLGEGKRQRLYFDTQTGLLLRVLTLTKTVLTEIPEQVDFSDYREVQGVKLPFTMRSSFIDPWIGASRKFVEIKSTSIDDQKFEVPRKPQ